MFNLRLPSQFFVLFLILSFVSCSKEVEVVNKVLLKEDLEASIYQDLRNKDSYLFQVSTIEHFDCGNSFIISSSKFENNNLDVVIEGVFIPNVCVDSSRILNTIHHFNLNNLEPCDFSINVQDLYKVEGAINRNPKTSQLEVTLSEAPRIIFNNYKVNHVDEDYLWFGFDLDDENTHELDVKINNAIKPFIDESKMIKDGHFGYFDVKNGTKTVYKGTSTTKYKSAFVFRLKDPIVEDNHPVISAVQQLFKQYPELYNQDYKVMTGTGFEII